MLWSESRQDLNESHCDGRIEICGDVMLLLFRRTISNRSDAIVWYAGMLNVVRQDWL